MLKNVFYSTQYEEGQGARLYTFSGGFNYTGAVGENTPSEQNLPEQDKTTVINIGSSPIKTGNISDPIRSRMKQYLSVLWISKET